MRSMRWKDRPELTRGEKLLATTKKGKQPIFLFLVQKKALSIVNKALKAIKLA